MNPAGGFFQRLLVPVDGSNSSLKAARYAARLALSEGCEMLVLHVVDEETAEDMASYADRPVTTVLERMQHSGESYLEDVRRIGREAGLEISGEVRVGIPHRVILEVAVEEHVDLILMGTVGRKGPRRVLIGSVTERIIAHAPVPVLVVN